MCPPSMSNLYLYIKVDNGDDGRKGETNRLLSRNHNGFVNIFLINSFICL